MRRALARAGAALAVLAALGAAPAPLDLGVPPAVAARERCGPAALAMVLRWYGADSAAVREADRAYDPALRGALVTDLAAAARRAGFRAESGPLDADSLVALLRAGVPPIVLYQAGPAPLTRPHYAVVRGWDPGRDAFRLNDGGAAPRTLRRGDLVRRWRTAGSQALVVRRAAP